MSEQHTPTFQYVRNAYIAHRHSLAAEQGEFPPGIVERMNEFDRWLNQIEAAAEQRGAIKALRDVEGSLIDWEVIYGHEQGTAEDHESIRIAAWIGRRADLLEGDE